MNRVYTRCLDCPILSYARGVSVYSSIGRNRWNEVTDSTGSGRTCMSADLKRVQQYRGTRRGICFYEGFLVSGRLMHGSSWLYRCCHSVDVSSSVIQVTKVSPFCGVVLGVHCNTSAAVYSHSLQGQASWPRRVSCRKLTWCTTPDQESRYKSVLVLTTSQGWLGWMRYPVK